MRLRLLNSILTLLFIFTLTSSETILISSNQNNPTSKLENTGDKIIQQISVKNQTSKEQESKEIKTQQNPIVNQTNSNQTKSQTKPVPVLLPLKRRENQFIDTKDNLSYKFDIQNKDGNILVHILDSQLKRHELKIDNQNQLRLVDTYRNLIIIKQIEPSQDQSALDQLQLNIYEYLVNTTLRYYHVYQIQPLTINDTLLYQAKFITRVNATFDEDEYDIANYSMLGVTQLDQRNQFLYISNIWINQQYDMYRIDLKQNQTKLHLVNWIAPQNNLFIGGNSRVLVDAWTNQIFVDQNNTRESLTDPTIFQRFNLSQVSKELQFYPGNTHVADLNDWNFYVYSHSDDNLKFSGFLYWGYSGNTIASQVSLTSDQPIKYFFDSYYFFIAICSKNVLWNHLQWDQSQKLHVGFTITAQLLASNESHLQSMVNNFKNAEQIIYVSNQLFVITNQSIFVYHKKDYDLDADKQIKLNDVTDWKQNKSYSNNEKFILQYLQDKRTKTSDKKQIIVDDEKPLQSNQNKTVKQGDLTKQNSENKHMHPNQRQNDDRRFFK